MRDAAAVGCGGENCADDQQLSQKRFQDNNIELHANATPGAPSTLRMRYLDPELRAANGTDAPDATCADLSIEAPYPPQQSPTTQSPRMLFAASECGTIGTDPSMLFAARNDMKPIIARRPSLSSASCLRLSDSGDMAPDRFAQS